MFVEIMAAFILLFVTGAGSTWGANVPEVAGNKHLSVVIMAPSHYFPESMGAFNVAFEEIKNRQLLPGYTIDWTFRDTDCNPFQGMLRTNLIFDKMSFNMVQI